MLTNNSVMCLLRQTASLCFVLKTYKTHAHFTIGNHCAKNVLLNGDTDKSRVKINPNFRKMTSQTRQNYHEDCEEAINKQINMELYASYVYMFMAYHFDRDDVALKGFHNYFKKASDEEREHAMKFMKYQNKRGGKISLSDIKAPVSDWETPQEAMVAALELEKEVNESLLRLHAIAGDRKDVHLCDFLESEYLQEQVDAIKELSDHVTNLKRVGEGLGVFMFDRELSREN